MLHCWKIKLGAAILLAVNEAEILKLDHPAIVLMLCDKTLSSQTIFMSFLSQVRRINKSYESASPNCWEVRTFQWAFLLRNSNKLIEKLCRNYFDEEFDMLQQSLIAIRNLDHKIPLYLVTIRIAAWISNWAEQ